MGDTNDLADLMANPQVQDIMMNQVGLDSMGGMEGLLSMFATAGIIFKIFSLGFFLLRAWGLWNINKKLGEPYPWLAWIPLLQMYSFVKAGGKNGIWILWIILGFIFFIIPGLILIINVMHSTSKRTGRGIWTTLGFIFFPYIMYPVVGYKLQGSNLQNEGSKIKQDSVNMSTSEEL